jgi:hypothetical protein
LHELHFKGCIQSVCQNYSCEFRKIHEEFEENVAQGLEIPILNLSLGISRLVICQNSEIKVNSWWIGQNWVKLPQFMNEYEGILFP